MLNALLRRNTLGGRFALAVAVAIACVAAPTAVLAVVDAGGGAGGQVAASAVGTVTVEPAPADWPSAWQKSFSATMAPSGDSGRVAYWYSGKTGYSFTETDTPVKVPINAHGIVSVAWGFTTGSLTPSVTETHTIKIDGVAPSSVATAVPAADLTKWRPNNTFVRLSARDLAGGSGLSQFYHRIDSGAVTTHTVPAQAASFTAPDILVSTNGTTTITYWAKDVAGNVEPVKTQKVFIDKVAPQTSAPGAKASYVNTATISLVASDTLSGVKTTRYSLTGAAAKTGTGASVEATTPGAYSLRFWSEDNAGNVETSTTASNVVTFTVTADRVAPVTAISGGVGVDLTKWQPGDVTFTLAATDGVGGSDIANTFYRLGAGAVTTYTAPVVVPTEGMNTVTYWSVDKGANKEADKTASIRIDKTKPSSADDAKPSYSANAAVIITASDTLSGVGSISWWINNGAPTVVQGGGAPTFSTVASSSLVGTQTLSYVVKDVVGNHEATQTAEFHIMGNPTVALTTKSHALTNTTIPAKSSVSGKLLNGGTGVGGKQVVLERSSSSKFTTFKTTTVTTAADGSFTFPVKLWKRVYYRVWFAGDADAASAVSARITLLPRAQLSVPKATSYTKKAGRSFTVWGRIKPAHAKSAKVYVQRYQLVKGKWAKRKSIRTAITPRSGFSGYKTKLKLSKGTWRIRAYHPYDKVHKASVTSWRTVKVK